jgi:tRNA(fMet)-specific endonuclease VapC
MAVEQCVALFEVLPFERNTAEIFGSIVGELEKQGHKISDIDALIASVALEHSEVLVTRNRKHFDRIPGLQVEGY